MKFNSDLRNIGIDGLVFCSVLSLATMAACSRDPAPPGTVVVQSAPAPAQVVQVVQAPPVVVMEDDDYVYYPHYEIYYSSRRREYGYRDGNAWAWRPAPPHIAVNVLFSSPSVHMDFHDAPALHHESMVRAYPRNWSPPAKGRDDRNEHKDEHHDERKERH